LKKSPLESKIFANMLHELGFKVDIANDTKELINMIDEETGLIFVDKETEGLALSALREELKLNAPHAAVVLMTDPTSEVTPEERELSDEVIVNLVNRDLIRLIVEKFIKSEG